MSILIGYGWKITRKYMKIDTFVDILITPGIRKQEDIENMMKKSAKKLKKLLNM